jgi:phosphoesterase RecJ-like protein
MDSSGRIEPIEGAVPRWMARALPDDVLSRCVRALERGRRFLVTMHQEPDGDALGSSLALSLLLREQGREALVYSHQGVPAPFAFLPGADRVVRGLPRDARFDVTVACDAGSPSRLGPDLPDASRRGVLLNLDHHLTTPHFGDVNLIDVQAASVGVLIYRLAAAMNRDLSRDVATCLWVSLIADTGNFRYSNTDPECLRIAADLVTRGVRPWDVSSRLHNSQPLERVKLLAEVLKTLTVSGSGRIAWVTATQELFDRFGTSEETSEGFIHYPRSIAGVEVAIVFREEPSGKVKLSFRSRGRADVSAVAVRLGGGGHHNASGCTLDGELSEVRAHVVREVERELARTLGSDGNASPAARSGR